MELSRAYTPNYYSIEDILATQEKTPCKFIQNVPKLGKLDSATEDPDIKAGTVLELPVWLASELSSGRQPVVAPELPKVYKESYREILKADPSAVNLHKFGPYFYELGLHVRKFSEAEDVLNILLYTFKMRFRQLMDLANNSKSDPTVQQSLDMLERSLYRTAHEASLKLDAWLKNSIAPLEAAHMVVNHKKRKRVDIEDLA